MSGALINRGAIDALRAYKLTLAALINSGNPALHASTLAASRSAWTCATTALAALKSGRARVTKYRCPICDPAKPCNVIAEAKLSARGL